MTIKHTTGPWEEDATLIWNKRLEQHIATIVYQARPHAECKANARLVASAPDLLAHCKMALDALETANRMLPEDEPTFDTAPIREAIARATGGDGS